MASAASDLRSAAPSPPMPAPVLGLDELYRAHHALVLKAAYRITGSMNDAEDVLQTVFLRLAGRDFATAMSEVSNVQGYLHRAAVNAALDIVRARQEGRSTPIDEHFDLAASGPHGSPERNRSSAEIRMWLTAALERLTPRAAEVFALRYLEELDNQEIARMLGATESSIGVLLHRARTQLQQDYRQQFPSSTGRSGERPGEKR